MNGTHRCPVTGCAVWILADRVMCRRHWRQAPAELQDKIYLLYRTARGSSAHLAAIREAIASVNAEAI